MAGYDPYTENLADFGYQELDEAIDIINGIKEYGLPEGFEDRGVRLAFNRNSGYVFLTNDEYQVCMSNDGKDLFIWHVTPYSGFEGSLEGLVEQYKEDPDDWDEEDVQYLRDWGADV